MPRSVIFSILITACLFLPHLVRAQGVPSKVWSLKGNRGANQTAFLGTTDAADLRIGTNATTRIFIGSDGNIQMGSAADPSDFDVFGNLDVSGVVTGVSGARFGAATDYGAFSASGLLQFSGAGSYGVGSGQYVFQTLDAGGGLTGIGLKNSTGGAALELFHGSNTSFSVAYATGNTNISGDASIGGSAAVTGNATVSGDGSFGGSVGIGGTNPDGANYALYINGRLRSNGINELSDRRMKHSVASLDNALTSVLQLRGVRYEWRRDEYPELSLPAGQQVGLIAQEVEAVVPEIVHTDAEGTKSVEYAHLVAVFVEAIKEQQSIIEQQAQTIEAVRAEMRELRAAFERSVAAGEAAVRTTEASLRPE